MSHIQYINTLAHLEPICVKTVITGSYTNILYTNLARSWGKKSEEKIVWLCVWVNVNQING